MAANCDRIDLAKMPKEFVYYARPHQITVGERYRKNLGDMDRLKRSIAGDKKAGTPGLGILNPLAVTDPNSAIGAGRMRLILGGRRLAAAVDLRLRTVPVRLCRNLDTAQKLLLAERDENADGCREPMSASDMGRLAAELLRLAAREAAARRAKTLARKGQKVGAGGAKNGRAGGKTKSDAQGEANLASRSKQAESAQSGRALDTAAAAVGRSPETVRKAVAVTTAAELDPAGFGDLPAVMDEESVHAAHRELLRRKGAASGPATNGTPTTPAAPSLTAIVAAKAWASTEGGRLLALVQTVALSDLTAGLARHAAGLAAAGIDGAVARAAVTDGLDKLRRAAALLGRAGA
jgi:hypothetical protein